MKYFTLIITLIVIYACAQQGALEVPLDDIKLSTVDSTFPSQKQVNVDIKSPIYIRFSENMNKESVEKATLFYPFMNRYTQYNWKNSRELEIEIDTTLKENFVHFITIKNTASDLYNRNMEDPINFVFSTGDTIYENKISGRVIGNDYKNIPNIDIFLYEFIPADTLMFDLNYIQKGYTSSGRDGRYSFKNINNGKYIIFGIDDKNNNGLHDNGETVCVAPDTIIISPESDTNLLNNVNLYSFNDSRELFIETVQANYDGLFEIKFNKNIFLNRDNILKYISFFTFDSVQFDMKVIDAIQLDNKRSYGVYFNSDVDTTVNLYATFNYDSTLFRDSLLSEIDTSINRVEFRYYPKDDTTSLFITDYSPKGVYSGESNIVFHFNRVLSEIDKENMEFLAVRKVDTTTNVDTLQFSTTIFKNSLIIEPVVDSVKFLKNCNLTFSFYPNSVFDVKKIAVTDTIVKIINTLKETTGGDLDVLVKSNRLISGTNIVLFLTSRTKNNALIYNTKSDSNFISLKNIPEDFYSIKGFIDNGNETIDYNSIYSQTPFCETILTGNDSLKVRTGWATSDTIYGY